MKTKSGDFIEVDYTGKLKEENIILAFKPFDIIYVYGGNTFYLMYFANKSGFTFIPAFFFNSLTIGPKVDSYIVGVPFENHVNLSCPQPTSITLIGSSLKFVP